MAEALGGRYQLISVLGEGPTGRVWRAEDISSGQSVSVKVIHSSLAGDARLVDRLVRSRSVLLGLWDDGIARVRDVVWDERALALVSELATGVDLGRRLEQGPIPVAEAIEIARVVAGALAAAHRVGVVHGDLKPSNVVTRVSGADSVKVTDFLLHLLIRAGRAEAEQSRYGAPEVIQGTVPLPPSDIFALGGLIHDMVDGLRAGSLLLPLINRCTDPDPGFRPTADEVRSELAELAKRPEAAASAGGLRGGGEAGGRAGGAEGRVGGGKGGPARREPKVRRAAEGRAESPLLRGGNRWPLVAGAAALAIVAAVITVVLGSGGGGSGAEPGGASETARVAEPAFPAGAAEQSREGGQQFVRYWFALFSYAVQTGDLNRVTALTRSDCAQCATALSSVRQGHEGAGRINGGQFTVRDVTTNTLWTPKLPIFDATIDRAARSTVDGQGATTGTVPGLAFTNCQLVLEWAGSGWRLYEVTTAGCLY